MAKGHKTVAGAVSVMLLLLVAEGCSPRSCTRSGPQVTAPGATGPGQSAGNVAEAVKAGPEISIELDGQATMRLVLIPAGSFMMGDAVSDLDCEKPVHKVVIGKPFYLGKYEVTQRQWQAIMGSNPSWFSPTGFKRDRVAGMDTGRFPVESVAWEDAMEFCRKLSAQPEQRAAGRVYRLPTEAEWEYACRAGSTKRYGFADDAAKLGDYAWYWRNSERRTHQVGGKKPNAWGLYDMQGNAWEWCADWRSLDYYKHSPPKDPTGPESGRLHVVRGGSWLVWVADYLRCGSRLGPRPDDYEYHNGFRVVGVVSP